LLNGNNLTSSLSNNYIPKWNGVLSNSILYDSGSSIGIGITSPNSKLHTSGSFTFDDKVYSKRLSGGLYLPIVSYWDGIGSPLTGNKGDILAIGNAGGDGLSLINGNSEYIRMINGNTLIGYQTDQSYKLAVNGTGMFSSSVTAPSFYGSGSNLTGVQLPITLTTTGTSGPATMTGSNINIPNYSGSGIVNQSQTTINGSTSGTIVGSMPFQTGSYKKVIIRSNALSGGVTYTLPTTFTYVPHIWATIQGGTIGAYDCTTTAFTTSGQTNFTGWFVIEGY